MRTKIAVLVLAGLASTLQADFSYTQTSQITGGSILSMTRWMPGGGKMREPQTSSFAIKGNKMITGDKDQIQVIDIDAETITQINLKDKKYSVITFAEMQQAMAALAERMKAMQAQMAQAQQQMPPENPAGEMRVAVNETGQTRAISGVNTKQMILTMETPPPAGAPEGAGSKHTADFWMASSVPGYEEVNQFYQRAAAKMAGMYTPGMNSMAMMRQDISASLKRMAEEMSKLQGIAIEEKVTIMGAGGTGPNVGEAAKGAAKDAAVQGGVGAALGRTRLGGLGGLGGLGRRKQEPPPQQAPPPAEAKIEQVVLMETVTTKSGFSNAPIEASRFTVPAGFKQEEHPIKKMAQAQ